MLAISSAPAGLALVLLCLRLIWSLLGRRPQWTKPFVREEDLKMSEDPDAFRSKNVSKMSITLLALSVVGAVMNFVEVPSPFFNLLALPPAVAWVSLMILAGYYAHD